jgi:hypothetical protein
MLSLGLNRVSSCQTLVAFEGSWIHARIELGSPASSARRSTTASPLRSVNRKAREYTA